MAGHSPISLDERNALLTFLEDLPAADIDRVIGRVKDAKRYDTGQAIPSRVATLVQYVESSAGPELPALVKVVDGLFPDWRAGSSGSAEVVVPGRVVTREQKETPVPEEAKPRSAKTVTWLHLSDWHQRGKDFDRRVVRDALVKDIRERASRVHPDVERVDFVFFTGDLAFSGKAEEYATARKELLDPVLEAVGVPKERLYIIPGNHDLDRATFDLLPNALLHPFTDAVQVKEWLENTKKRARLLEPFEAYQAFVDDYKAPGFGAYGSFALPEVNGVRLGVVGLNSAFLCARRQEANGSLNDFGALVAGEPQVYDALEGIGDTDLRIGLIHHPFEWLTEFDRQQVERRMRQGCDVILRGHQHTQTVEIVSGAMGNSVIVPGGACYDGRVPERPIYVNAYNFLTVDMGSGDGAVYLRQWGDRKNAWIADYETAEGGVFHFRLGRTLKPNPQ